MKLNKNEYTIKSLIYYLNKKFGSKNSGKEFNHSDIAQYERRGYLPYRYSGDLITAEYIDGMKILTLKKKPSSNKSKNKKKKQ